MTRDLTSPAPSSGWAAQRGKWHGGLVLVGGMCLLAVLADVLAPGNPFEHSDHVLQPPTWSYPLGSDDFGRDLWRSVVHGARVSLLVALVASVASLAIGIIIGASAAYRGGWVDDGLMRVTEVFQVVPRLFLVLTVVALFGSGLAILIAVVALTSWASTARLVRSQVMAAVTFEHVQAARATGAGAFRVLARHVWPLSRATLAAHGAFQASNAILLEAGVSFLGLGDPTVMSWGVLLHEAHHFLRVAWWMAVFPGLALTMTVLGLHLIADSLAEPPRRL